MGWNIIVYESNRKEKPVEEFIKSQQQKTKSKISQAVDLLEEYGLVLTMPHVRKLTRKIFELRVRGQEEIRILFAASGKNIYLLHGFKKKTQKTPPKEIEIAQKRFETIAKI